MLAHHHHCCCCYYYYHHALSPSVNSPKRLLKPHCVVITVGREVVVQCGRGRGMQPSLQGP